MKWWRRLGAWLGLPIVALLVAIVPFLISPTSQRCITRAYKHATESPEQEGGTYLGLAVAQCATKFFTAEIVIAYFTVILGIATWFLWFATRKLVVDAKNSAADQLIEMKKFASATEAAAAAAQKAANVAAGVQVAQFPIIHASWSGHETGIDLKQQQMPPRREISISACNKGLTDAIAVGYSVDFKIADQLPEAPAYPDPVRHPVPEAIESDNYFRIDLTKDELDYSDPEIVRVFAKQTNFWLYGYLEYRDFLGTNYVQGFVKRLKVGMMNDKGRTPYPFIDEGPPGIHLPTIKRLKRPPPLAPSWRTPS